MNVFVSLCLPSEVSAPSKSTRRRWLRNSESLKAFEKTWKCESKQSLNAQFDGSVHILSIILFSFGHVLIFRSIYFFFVFVFLFFFFFSYLAIILVKTRRLCRRML